MVLTFVCPCLPPAIPATLDHFDTADILGSPYEEFNDSEELGLPTAADVKSADNNDRPAMPPPGQPSPKRRRVTADVAQGDAAASSAMPPPADTPVMPPSAQTSPKRRRVSRKTSAAHLPANVIGDEEIKAAFLAFMNRGAEATAGAEPQVENEDSIVAEVNEYMRRINVKYRQWPYYMKRLAAAVLATYEIRFVDVTELEKVTLL